MQRKNKILSLIIAFGLIVSMIPMTAFAVEETAQTAENQEFEIEENSLSKELLATQELTLSVVVDTEDWQKAILEWNPIIGAIDYTVMVDGMDSGAISTEYDDIVRAEVTVPEAGTYKFKVVAKTENKNIASEVKKKTFVSTERLIKVNAYSTYNGIDLTWSKSIPSVEYAIYEGNKKIGQTTKGSYYVKVNDEKKHKYRVCTVVDGEESERYVTSKAKTRVLGIKYNLKFGSTCKLTCWTKGHKQHKKTFKKGQKLVADEFRMGCYKYYKKGHQYSIKRIRLTNVDAKGWYNYKKYYSPEEATRYVNRRNLSSNEKTLIFVSTKSQHIYLFKGSKNNWKIDKHWVVSTGSPNTPTPAGSFVIHYKWSIHNGLRYWSACSTFSLHGKAKSWKLGGPKSGGCIRNENEQAHYIYSKYRCGTKVCVF